MLVILLAVAHVAGKTGPAGLAFARGRIFPRVPVVAMTSLAPRRKLDDVAIVDGGLLTELEVPAAAAAEPVAAFLAVQLGETMSTAR
jgi:hypothetical protein